MARAPCCDKNGLKKGPWTPEEDQKLIDYIQKHGYGNWRTLPKNAGLQRCGKSCRLRWTNYLRPDIKRGRFSFEEEETIIQLHSILGNKWSAIASRLPGRTDNEIKNYWNTHIRKRLLRMGIDPVTHTTRLDLLDLSTLLNPHLLHFASSLQQSIHLNNLPPFTTTTTPQSHFTTNHDIPPYAPYPPPSSSSNFTTQIPTTMTTTTLLTHHHYDPVLPQLYADHCYNNNNTASNCDNHRLQLVQDTDDYHTNNNFSATLASVLSTPSNSNSTYINSTEDERESYNTTSNIYNFQIPDILDLHYDLL